LPGVPVPQIASVNTDSNNNVFNFSGTALPGQEVIIYIHSDQAIVYRVKADNNGNWLVNHSQDILELSPGEHSIYAVAVDTGARVKSQPSLVSTFTVSRNWIATILSYLNLRTTAITLVVLLTVSLWLYRLKRAEAATSNL